MASETLKDAIVHQLDQLTPDQQQRLLNFARVLANTPALRGESGQSVIASAGLFRDEDLEEMMRAIEEGCECSGTVWPVKEN